MNTVPGSKAPFDPFSFFSCRRTSVPFPCFFCQRTLTPAALPQPIRLALLQPSFFDPPYRCRPPPLFRLTLDSLSLLFPHFFRDTLLPLLNRPPLGLGPPFFFGGEGTIFPHFSRPLSFFFKLESTSVAPLADRAPRFFLLLCGHNPYS